MRKIVLSCRSFATGLAVALLLGGCAHREEKNEHVTNSPVAENTRDVRVGVEKPEPTAPKVNRVFTKIVGIDDKVTRVAVLKAIQLRGLKRRATATDAQIRRLFQKAPGQIRSALEPFGYYQPEVLSDLSFSAEKYNALFTVKLGSPTTLREVQFELQGAGQNDAALSKAWAKFGLKVGEVLSHPRYESAKNEVQRVLLSRGYLDAELLQHVIEVERKSAQAVVKLSWQTGPRYALGETHFSGMQFSEQFMQRYVGFEAGDLYTQKRLLDLQQRLTDADYFSGIEITPELERDEAADEASDQVEKSVSAVVRSSQLDSSQVDPSKTNPAPPDLPAVVPIHIQVIPAKRSIYTYGLSFGTDSGVGVRGGLERRWVNDRGHKLRSAGEISQRLKAVALSYELPLPDKNRSNYALNLSYRDQETETSRSKLGKIGLAFSREWKDWQQTLALQAVQGDFEVGGEFGETTLLYPELILYKREADDFLYPRAGYAITFNARAGSKALLSDTDFANVSGEYRYIRGVGDADRLLLRGSLGALYAGDLNRLPPELRFFAGGDRSLRGYGYQELGPENSLGNVRGGKYLAVASAEYERAINESFSYAGFVDLGNAFDGDSNGASDSENKLKTSVGVGLRWRSPVGVVRIDTAFAIDEPGSPLRLHLVIGPDL